MKKLISLILFTAILISFCACSGMASSQTDAQHADMTAASSQAAPETTQEPPQSIKVLAIGNSFSVDAMWHLYTIAKAEGVKEIILGNMHIGGCSLEKHAGNAENNEAAYRYYKNTAGVWEETEMTSLQYALQDEQWDVVVIQQASHLSGIQGSYTPYLDNLIAYVKENISNPDYKLYWHMTWAYQADSTHASFPNYGNNQQTMYNSIIQAVQTIIAPNNAFTGIFPVGTVIQNSRTAAFVGDTLTRDGYHLSNLGRILASYTWYAVLTGQTLSEIKVTSFDVGFSLSQKHMELIVSAVNDAIAQPYVVTQQ